MPGKGFSDQVRFLKGSFSLKVFCVETAMREKALASLESSKGGFPKSEEHLKDYSILLSSNAYVGSAILTVLLGVRLSGGSCDMRH